MWHLLDDLNTLDLEHREALAFQLLIIGAALDRLATSAALRAPERCEVSAACEAADRIRDLVLDRDQLGLSALLAGH